MNSIPDTVVPPDNPNPKSVDGMAWGSSGPMPSSGSNDLYGSTILPKMSGLGRKLLALITKEALDLRE